MSSNALAASRQPYIYRLSRSHMLEVESGTRLAVAFLQHRKLRNHTRTSWVKANFLYSFTQSSNCHIAMKSDIAIK